jgi:hypothetical protein
MITAMRVTMDLMLDNALEEAEERDRVNAVRMLVPYVGPVRIAELLDLAANLAESGHRSWMIEALAAYLDHDQADRAWEISQTLTTRVDAWLAWAALLPRIRPTLRPSVLAALIRNASGAGKLGDNLFLRTLPHLSEAEAKALLTEIMGTPDIGGTVVWMASSAAVLPAGWRDRLIEAVSTIEDENSRAFTIHQLGNGASPDQRARLLQHTREIEAAGCRARAFAELLPSLPEDERPSVVAAALQSFMDSEVDDEIAALALGILLPYLAADQIGAVLETVPDRWDVQQVNYLRMLAPYLTPQQAERAVAMARDLRDLPAFMRLGPLGRLVPRLAGSARGALVAEFLSYASRWRHVDWAEVGLAPEQIDGMLDKAEAADEDERPSMLRVPATHGDAEQQARALRLAETINDPEIRDPLLLDLADVIDRGLVAEACVRLGATALAAQVNAATACNQIGDPKKRAEVIASLVPSVPEDKREALLRQAFLAMDEIEDSWARGEARKRLIPLVRNDV